MKISDIPPAEFSARLNGEGICLHAGPFVLHLRTSLSFVADAFRNLYADFSIAEADVLADFHASVQRPGGLRRWVRPQALFESDGDIPFYPLPLRLAMPLLEWGLNWTIAVHAHQYLIIHAAVLEREGRALLLPAPSGAGKSTLCAALAWRGWRLLTDELGLICPADSRIMPFPRPVSLKDASIGIIRAFASEAWIGPEWADTIKGTIAHMRPPADSVARAHETALPAWIVFAGYRSGAPARMEPIPRSRAFLRLADNAFNYSLLGTAGFEAMARVIDAATCYEFSYGNLDDAVAAFSTLSRQCEFARA